jgi:predicted DNA-binding protein with PD1-like motif
MGSAEIKIGRFFLLNAPHNSDLLKFLTEQAKTLVITAATFTAIGAVKSAKLAFYDQQSHQYSERELLYPQEIASCIGNISLKQGEPFVHAHAVLADANGAVKAGHLLEAKVFAAEIHLTELVGEKVEREPDAVTGLSLWNI